MGVDSKKWRATERRGSGTGETGPGLDMTNVHAEAFHTEGNAELQTRLGSHEKAWPEATTLALVLWQQQAIFMFA